MQTLWEEVEGHGIQVVAVHVSETEAEAQTWMTGLGVTFPAVQDGAGFPIFTSYSPSDAHVPRLYIIDREGVIRWDHLGSVTEDVLEGEVMDVVYLRDPIDVAMIMDVSDSMNSPPPSDPGGDSKLTLMRRAASMITQFLADHGQTDDRMGLVWFTDDVSEYANPVGDKLVSVQTETVTLDTEINTHPTGVCTAMGAGLQTAFDTLSASFQNRFAILCTDGMQNIEPKVTETGGHFEIIDSGGYLCGGHSSVAAHAGVDITTYDTKVHTIGVGVTATYATLLEDLANATGGFHRSTDDPDTDLDLIYFLDLCNCMATGSPAVAHHNVTVFDPGQCQTVEYFQLNRSVRKITVALGWKRSLAGQLTFWLRSPDGTLLDLNTELKSSLDHCMATLYLPRLHNGVELEHTGTWQMIIRGETGGVLADYHAFVIAEDRQTHFVLDYPRRLYEVGDVLPLKIKLSEKDRLLTNINGLQLETACLPVPLAELLAELPMSPYETILPLTGGAGRYKAEPLLAKIQALSSDPRFAPRFKPARIRTSLEKGDLQYHIGNRELTIPIPLEKAGQHSFKVQIHCETDENGPICRTDMVSVNVGPGKADPKTSRLGVQEIATPKKKGFQIRYTPRNRFGNLVGPGFSARFAATMGKRAAELAVEDLLNGTYLVELTVAATKKRKTPVRIHFDKQTIWKGTC